MVAMASASQSRCRSGEALPFSSATAMSRAATDGPSARAGWNGSSAWKPGWLFSSESNASKRSFTYSTIGGQERKLVAMESTPSVACARNASRALT